MKRQGKILNWNDDKGFGFVESNDGGERAFVHIKAFEPRSRRPVNGEVIAYELVRENNNRFKATNIKFARDLKTLKNRNKAKDGSSFGVAFILLFCIGLLVSTLFGKLPVIVAGLYLATSLITFVAYAIDKSAAKSGRWRTKESTLHLLSIIGGWPGAYFAQKKLRHKSNKREFKSIYWLTVFVNLGGFFWLHTEKGASFISHTVIPLLNS
jgi:uncharacterized membrane protein YsdA (DUF1294 family)/cold shock CspA family protein